MLKGRKLTTALVVGALTSLFIFIAALMQKGRLPRSDEWVFVVPYFSAIAIISGVIWLGFVFVFEHPNANMHNIEGVKRLSLVSLISGPLWISSEYIRGRILDMHVFSLTSYLLAIPFFSLALWFAINCLGWVISGFVNDLKK